MITQTIKLLAAAVISVIFAPFAIASVTDDVMVVVDQVKTHYAPDRRQSVYEIVVRENGDSTVIAGKISEPQTYRALVDMLKKSAVTSWVDSIIILPDTLWAQPRISVACVRTAPSHAAEMATQSIMGQPLRILETKDEWYRVQSPDGYIGWVTNGSLVPKTDDEMTKWRNSKRLIVTAPHQTHLWADSVSTAFRDIVSDLVLGNIVQGPVTQANNRFKVTLPDGRSGWVDIDDVADFAEWMTADFNPQLLLDIAYSMEGTPYLWGGTSVKSLDCSGLAKVSYFANGIILLRDASQQATTGLRLEPESWPSFEMGDLLFFGNPETGRVTHVAIYDMDGNYVHSSGRVKRNSIDSTSDMYLSTPFLHAVRIHGYESTSGITLVRNHPWYIDNPQKQR